MFCRDLARSQRIDNFRFLTSFKSIARSIPFNAEHCFAALLQCSMMSFFHCLWNPQLIHRKSQSIWSCCFSSIYSRFRSAIFISPFRRGYYRVRCGCVRSVRCPTASYRARAVLVASEMIRTLHQQSQSQSASQSLLVSTSGRMEVS